MTKVLIFTGAGASAPLGLPTTVEFNNEIFESPKKITSLTQQYLGEKHGSDIERLLSTLEEFGNSSGLTGFLIENLPPFNITYNNNNNNIGSSSTNTHQHINKHVTGLQNDTKSEVKRIKSIVYRKLQHFDKDKAYDLYKNLITEIKKEFNNCSICYSTANYDLTLDSALDNERDFTAETGIIDANYGFINKRGRSLYNSNTDYDWPSDHIEYLKVHGSLDWHPAATNGECVKSGSSVNPENPDDMVILYPGFKGIPSKEPFISLHNKLEERLKSSDIVIVIGFAFRDPYINSIFENAIKQTPNKKYILINPTPAQDLPDDSIVKRLKTHKNFIHIEEKLSTDENPLQLRNLLKEHAPNLMMKNQKT